MWGALPGRLFQEGTSHERPVEFMLSERVPYISRECESCISENSLSFLFPRWMSEQGEEVLYKRRDLSVMVRESVFGCLDGLLVLCQVLEGREESPDMICCRGCGLMRNGRSSLVPGRRVEGKKER